MNQIITAPYISDEALQEYFTTCANTCPVCKSSNIRSDGQILEGMDIFVTVRCQEDDCNAVWSETYTLSAVTRRGE